MRIGVPRETKPGEARVGLTPQGVRAITDLGHEVRVEAGAGAAIGYEDGAYFSSGAQAVDTASAWDSELIVKVKELQPGEAARFQAGSTLFSFQHLAGEPELTREVAARGGNAIAYEMVRDAEGQFALLSPMSRIAGRMAIPIGAALRHSPVERVLVLGAGHAGRAAADAALALGAAVTVLCQREATRDGLRAFYGERAQVQIATPEAIEAAALEADIVVGAVFIPATPTPKLLPRALVRRMRRGAVIVDVSIDAGGVAETSRPTTHAEPSFVEEGVVHYCVANIPAAHAREATDALAAATLPYVIEMATKGIARAVQENAALRSGVLIWGGLPTDAGIARDAGLRHRPLKARAA
jgi:alanine dehydrogenase